ncbi:DNA circularization protein [Mariprofundus ferrooxydans]|uniref:DNA circulation N-terminal domain-containing protein n=1 Tax=Mariprofundus ferrooxydans PV-1 TaxID=314345 RepID=Q0F1S2_9PROT|nr:DNA circularization N-terminal domain-containing protein [Mariprofundus ferrooxydans]EAU55828.1 hypothetical protein SPV1_02732 [Mariprofundus ferrooxydans PV-1]KON47026.1 DNA circulation family protein [Mariprofundus ferrooxydans]
MAWADQLLDASFKGITFEFISTDDGCDSAIVEHAYPYVNGADLEETGDGAWHTAGQAVFYGPDYEQRLQSFLKAVRSGGAGEFVHPIFGLVPQAVARLRTGSIRHDADNPDRATVAIEFIESTPASPFFTRSTASQTAEASASHGDSALSAVSTSIADVVDRLRAASPIAALDTLRAQMTAPLAQLAAGEGVVLSMLDVIRYPAAWATDIAALSAGMVDMFTFSAGSGLNADWINAQLQLAGLSSYSSAQTSGPIVAGTAPSEAQATAAAATSIRVTSAVRIAQAAGLVLQAESAAPSMSPTEVETVVNVARKEINAAIDQVRITYSIDQARTITEPLKDQALAVQEAGRAVIEARPPLVDKIVEAPANMRLLAHLWYADHDRATELYRLNGGRSVILEAGEQLHAYAG